MTPIANCFVRWPRNAVGSGIDGYAKWLAEGQREAMNLKKVYRLYREEGERTKGAIAGAGNSAHC